MRSDRRQTLRNKNVRRWMITGIVLLGFFLLTVNCSDVSDPLMNADELHKTIYTEAAAFNLDAPQSDPENTNLPLAGSKVRFSDELWAEVIDDIDAPGFVAPSTSTISLDVRDADLLDIIWFELWVIKLNHFPVDSEDWRLHRHNVDIRCLLLCRHCQNLDHT